MTNDQMQQLINDHGGIYSTSATDIAITDNDPKSATFGQQIPNPNPTYHYIFNDKSWAEARSMDEGKTFDLTNGGTAIKPDANQSQAAPTHTQHTVYNQDAQGNVTSTDTYTYTYDPADHQYHLDKSVPPEHKPITVTPGSKPPSKPEDWQPIKDPSGRVIALMDPVTGDRQAVSADATAKNPTIVQGQGGTIYSWDGSKLTVQVQGTAKPVEGSTQTRLVNGRNVQGTIIGGEFVPQKDLGPALQGAAVEGATRPNIVEGYHVTQTYQNGDWTTTDIGEKAIPDKPSVISAPSNQANIASMANGQITTQPNPNFIPTNQAEVGTRVSQLQQQASAKRDEFLGKVGPTYTVQQAQADWNQWWDQNVEPQRASLQQISQQAQAEEARKAAEQQRLNLSTAQTAGTSAVDAYKATMPYRVGPGFANLLGTLGKAYQGGPLPSTEQIQQGVMFKMPDLDQISQQATARALAHISPTAAGIAGTGPPSMLQQTPQDLTAGLNRTAYTFPGAGGGIVPSPTIPNPVAPFPNPVPAAGAFNTVAPSSAWTGAFQAAPAAAPYMQPNWQQPPNSNPWGTYQPAF